MHRIWTIPELRGMILEDVPHQGLVTMAQCNKSFFTEAAKHIWRDIEGRHLGQLWSTIQEEPSLYVALQARLPRWTVYFHSVHSIELPGYIGIRPKSLLLLISSILTMRNNKLDEPLFPFIETMVVDLGRNRACEDVVAACTLLLPPSIKDLSIEGVTHACDVALNEFGNTNKVRQCLLGFLNVLRLRCPVLMELKFGLLRQHCDGVFLEEISDAIAGLTSLRRFTGGEWVVTAPALRALGRLPSLTSLCCEGDQEEYGTPRIIPSNIPSYVRSTRLVSIISLSISGTPQEIVSLVDTMDCLSELQMTFLVGVPDGLGCVIANKFPNLERLTWLNYYRPSHISLRKNFLDFTACHRLEFFSFSDATDGDDGDRLDDDCISQMASALPLLRTLKVSHCGHDVSFHSFLALAEHCPFLEDLWLVAQSTRPLPLPPKASTRNNRNMSLSTSFHPCPHPTVEAAAFLFSLWPNLTIWSFALDEKWKEVNILLDGYRYLTRVRENVEAGHKPFVMLARTPSSLD